MKSTRISIHAIIIYLDNGNELTITETESGVVQVENTTNTNGEKMGLCLYPINNSIIEIVPEG